VDEFQLPDLSEALTDIEENAGVKLAFMFQRRKILRNIVEALLLDTSIHEDVRAGWKADAETHLINTFVQPVFLDSPQAGAAVKSSATPISLSGSDGVESPISRLLGMWFQNIPSKNMN